MLIDTHIHTSETSRCAEMSAAKLVEVYKKLGYDGIVIADHMKCEEFSIVKFRWRKFLPWRLRVRHWLRGYYNAKAAAGNDLTVLLGMEIRFLDSHNDYLLFGIDENFIYNNKNLHKYATLKDFIPLAKKHNILIVQAHPFREAMTVCDPALLDGMEVLNANHENNNEIARLWAKKHGLVPTAGTDYHGWGNTHYGIRLEQRVQDSFQLAAELRSGRYEIEVVREG